MSVDLTSCIFCACIVAVGCSRTPQAKISTVESPHIDKHAVERAVYHPDTSGANAILFLREGIIWQADTSGTVQKQITKEGYSQDFFWIPQTQRLITYGIYGKRVQIKTIDTDSCKEDIIWDRPLAENNAGDENGVMYYFTFSVPLDGSMIAYGGDFLDNENNGTYIYNCSTRSTRHFKCNNAIISPDGEELAWVLDNNLHVTFLADSSEKQLTHYKSARGVYESNPHAYYNLETLHGVAAWSRDGTAVYYYYGNYGQGADPENTTYHIHGVGIQDDTLRQITTSVKRQIDEYLDQSADGQYLYYSVMDVNGHVKFLKRVEIHSRSTIDINPANVLTGFPISVSASQRLLAYAQYEKYGERNGTAITGPATFVMDLNGANSRKLIDSALSPKWKFAE